MKRSNKYAGHLNLLCKTACGQYPQKNMSKGYFGFFGKAILCL